MAWRTLIVDLDRADVRYPSQLSRLSLLLDLPPEDVLLLGYKARAPALKEGHRLLALREGRVAWLAAVINVSPQRHAASGIEGPLLAIGLGRRREPEHDYALAQIAPSLQGIQRLTHPRQNLRHRSWLEDRSVEVLLGGRLQPHRTAFFGLLSKMDVRWRTTLARAAVALERHWREERRRGEEDWVDRGARGNPGGVPLDALLTVLDIGVVQPVALAAKISPRHRALFPNHKGPISRPDEETGGDPWDTDGLLRVAPEYRNLGERLERIRAQLRESDPSNELWDDLSAENDRLLELIQ